VHGEVLVAIAWISLLAGFLCAGLIVLDIARGHRQRMWIMNLVWPLTALYAGPLALLAWRRIGRPSSRNRGVEPAQQPQWQSVALAAMHCGSGCTLGDIVAEWFVFFVPLTLWGRRIFATWAVDFLAAFALGIAFQYFTIKPMQNGSVRQGLVAAVKADTASLTAWQIGMYGWMALATFVLFGQELPKTDPVFWFMMQIAMLCGFVTAYPVNAWLLFIGVKEKMEPAAGGAARNRRCGAA
jgi:Domain of unknown function (DUF4396)